MHEWFAGGSQYFFPAQAFAIMFEDAVIAMGKKVGIKPSTLLYRIGYVWTTLWFIYTFPMWMDPMVKANFMEDSLIMPVSIIEGVTRGQWATKGTGSGRAAVAAALNSTVY